MIVENLVSVVIPVRNRPRLVVEAVESALAQDWRPIELIVVDDASDDATPAALATLARRHEGVLRVETRSRAGGPGVARETGRREIRGEFVQYLDSDDLLASGKVRRQVETLRARPECDLCWGRDEVLLERPGAPPRRVARSAPEVDRLFPSLLLHKLWLTFNPLYRRSLVDRMGPWAPLWNFQDWEYDGRAAASGARPCFVDFVTGSQRRGPYARVSTRHRLRRQAGAQAAAYEAMLGHAVACGVAPDAPEMAVFVRRLFRMARRCGAAGRSDTSRRLFGLARGASANPAGRDWACYEATARRFGWRAAGVLAEGLDRLRPFLRRFAS